MCNIKFGADYLLIMIRFPKCDDADADIDLCRPD